MIKGQQYLSDEELLSNYYKSSDNYWLGMLLQRYSLLMLGVCMKYLNNEDEAKDAVQEVMMHTLTELKRHKVSYFKSWIFSVTKNHCLLNIRRNKNRNPMEEIDEEKIESLQEDSIENKLNIEKSFQQLEESMDELTSEQKKTIELFYYQNKSYKEIEIITGYSSKQVKSYIQNGKRNLKLSIDKKQLKENG